MILLNPGPVTLSRRVREALLRPDLCHREPEFSELQSAVREGLLQVYGLDRERWAAVLLTGSGTAAVEAMVATLGRGDGQLLVVENGVYGERIAHIAELHGLAPRRLTHDWGEAVDLEALDATLATMPAPAQVAVVHHETTTGRLNDLAAIAAVCARHGAELLVDAVSSFGAEAIDADAWPVTALAATANKCLHGVPGTAFVVVRREALADTPGRTLYLDLARYCTEQDRGGTPFTQAIQPLYALDEALRELADDGGWRARHGRYGLLGGIVADGLGELGLTPLLPEAERSVVLTAYPLPPGMEYAALHDALKREGFVIYAGQGPLARRLFRIATMGDVGAGDMYRLVDAVRRAVARSGAHRR